MKGKVVVNWMDDVKAEYDDDDTVVDVEKRIVTVRQKNRTLIIPFENIALIGVYETERAED